MAQKETVLVFDIDEIARDIEDRLSSHLHPYTEGFYLRNKENPIFVYGRAYFNIIEIHNEQGQLTQLTKNQIDTPLDTVGIIYDFNGKEVFDPSGIKKLDKVFLTKPNLPFRGYNLIKEYLGSFIHNQLSWGGFAKKTLRDVLEEKLHQPFALPELMVFEDFIRDQLRDIVQSVIEFMDRDYTNVYDITIKNGHLKIFKMLDFRIYEYERIKAELEDLKKKLNHEESDE